MASIVKQAITSGLWYGLLKYQLNNFCIRDIEEITKSLLCKFVSNTTSKEYFIDYPVRVVKLVIRQANFIHK